MGNRANRETVCSILFFKRFKYFQLIRPNLFSNQKEMEVPQKKSKMSTEGSEGDGGEDVQANEGVEMNEAEPPAASEEMEANIRSIHEKIDQFTQQVSELLENGKALFSDLSVQFQERLISIHKEQVDKWEENIKELRSLNETNEAARNTLQSAQLHLLQTVSDQE